MKKLIFTGLLGLGLLLPYNLSAYNSTSVFAKEFSSKKPKKSKTNKKSRSKKSSSSSKGCSYNGQQLYVGSRGGCYYYSGSNKQYVDRSYCASCN
ncbi:hypothetical protein [Chryseobacterium sp. T20]|uniref:hypothetical protein n=1 Tax=Chryseobacterium sp. T20 TaxID=3395375 RepID=UPI0039BC3BCC